MSEDVMDDLIRVNLDPVHGGYSFAPEAQVFRREDVLEYLHDTMNRLIPDGECGLVLVSPPKEVKDLYVLKDHTSFPPVFGKTKRQKVERPWEGIMKMDLSLDESLGDLHFKTLFNRAKKSKNKDLCGDRGPKQVQDPLKLTEKFMKKKTATSSTRRT
jgi:hypothetical protein